MFCTAADERANPNDRRGILMEGGRTTEEVGDLGRQLPGVTLIGPPIAKKNKENRINETTMETTIFLK